MVTGPLNTNYRGTGPLPPIPSQAAQASPSAATQQSGNSTAAPGLPLENQVNVTDPAQGQVECESFSFVDENPADPFAEGETTSIPRGTSKTLMIGENGEGLPKFPDGIKPNKFPDGELKPNKQPHPEIKPNKIHGGFPNSLIPGENGEGGPKLPDGIKPNNFPDGEVKPGKLPGLPGEPGETGHILPRDEQGNPIIPQGQKPITLMPGENGEGGPKLPDGIRPVKLPDGEIKPRKPQQGEVLPYIVDGETKITGAVPIGNPPAGSRPPTLMPGENGEGGPDKLPDGAPAHKLPHGELKPNKQPHGEIKPDKAHGGFPNSLIPGENGENQPPVKFPDLGS